MKEKLAHQSVMVREILEQFRGVNHPVKKYFDGTFGRGGHFRAVLETFPEVKGVCCDQDSAAIAYGQETFAREIAEGRLQLIHKNFAEFIDLQEKDFDIMLLDLGVSSPQLDEAQRGFSFYHPGPLDMRMDQNQDLTAADIINEYDEVDLLKIFKEYGEVQRPQRVVRALVHDRQSKKFTQTDEVAKLIERVDGWRIKGQHPATKYFMALRICVNDELNVLRQSLKQLCEGLAVGGRLAVLSFHSLEDRIVKHVFRDLATGETSLGELVHKRVIIPSDEEMQSNPRSRSAKLRTFQRGSVQ